MKQLAVSLVLATAVLAGGRVARAQAPGQTPAYVAPPTAAVEYESVTTTERYGYQIAMADGAALLSAFAIEHGGGGAMIGIYLAGGPIIHFAHGQLGRGFLSFGLRVGLPYLGMMAGAAEADRSCADSDEFLCGLGDIVLGGAIGALTASVIDWTLLARKTTTMSRPALFRVGGVRANPDVGVTRGGVRLGLSGSF